MLFITLSLAVTAKFVNVLVIICLCDIDLLTIIQQQKVDVFNTPLRQSATKSLGAIIDKMYIFVDLYFYLPLNLKYNRTKGIVECAKKSYW
jgi:hypothetical protein